MKKTKVLFVDDDISLGNIVTLALNSSGFETYFQTSLAAINSVIREIMPDIIILDVEIGERNGIDITPELRILTPDIPILFVSSHTNSEEATKALNAGGIAYLRKPFEIEELIAYINRHAKTSCHEKINLGNLMLDIKENVLIKDHTIIENLSLSECKLLKLLVINKNQVVTREEIQAELWGQYKVSEHSLNNYISKLRKILSIDTRIELKNIPKTGYKLMMP